MPFENIMEKGENTCTSNQYFVLITCMYTTKFSILQKKNLAISAGINLLSANSLNLGQLKVLWFGKVLSNVYAWQGFKNWVNTL